MKTKSPPKTLLLIPWLLASSLVGCVRWKPEAWDVGPDRNAQANIKDPMGESFRKAVYLDRG